MISAIRKLVLGERRDNENFSFPYWVIVQPRWGNDILLAGVWFSREDAEHHLKCHGDVFGRRAVVRCMSAVRAESGLRKLYLHLMSEAGQPTGPAPIDYPKVAPEDVIVGRAYWVRGTPGRGGPYIVHARVDPRDQKMQFFDGHACGNTMYRRDITEIYGPIPLPSGLSSEVPI